MLAPGQPRALEDFTAQMLTAKAISLRYSIIFNLVQDEKCTKSVSCITLGLLRVCTPLNRGKRQDTNLFAPS